MNLLRSGQPTKITPRAHRRFIKKVTAIPRPASKELQASLVPVKVRVRDSTIEKRLGKNGIQIESSRRKVTKKAQRLVSHLPKNILKILGKYSVG